jgi:hypothetical protein
MPMESPSSQIGAALSTLQQLQQRPEDVCVESVEMCLQVLPRHYLTHYPTVAMPSVRGAPPWCAFELRIWELGEVIRHYVRIHRAIRGKTAIFDAMASVVADPRFGKGRQMHVLVLGQFGGATYAPVIASMLDDDDVMGHAVTALAALKAPGYANRIESILRKSEYGWIRRAARSYLQRTSKSD